MNRPDFTMHPISPIPRFLEMAGPPTPHLGFRHDIPAHCP